MTLRECYQALCDTCGDRITFIALGPEEAENVLRRNLGWSVAKTTCDKEGEEKVYDFHFCSPLCLGDYLNSVEEAGGDVEKGSED
jgi:hypothetical protein